MAIENAGLLPTLLRLRSPDGWSAFHHLAEKHGRHMKYLLDHMGTPSKILILNVRNIQRSNFPVGRMLCGQAEAYVDILKDHADLRAYLTHGAESFHEGWSPVHVLAEHYGAHFYKLLSCLSVSEVMEFLGVRNTSTKLPVAYMFCSKQIAWFIRLLEDRAELVVHVASLHTQEGWSVFHHMAEKYGTQMLELVSSVPHFAPTILAERSTNTQLPVCYMVAVHFPEIYSQIYLRHESLREAMVIPTYEGWTAFHHLAEKHGRLLVTVLRSLNADEVLAVLRLINMKKNNLTVAHFYAATNGPFFLQVLAGQPEVRRKLMDLGDADGWTVFHVFARKYGEDLRTLLRALDEGEILDILHSSNLVTHRDNVFETFTRAHPALAADFYLSLPSSNTLAQHFS